MKQFTSCQQDEPGEENNFYISLSIEKYGHIQL